MMLRVGSDTVIAMAVWIEAGSGKEGFSSTHSGIQLTPVSDVSQQLVVVIPHTVDDPILQGISHKPISCNVQKLTDLLTTIEIVSYKEIKPCISVRVDCTKFV